MSDFAHAVRYKDSGGVWHALAGIKGEAGEGVPTGGTAGQVLVKKSATNYDAVWGKGINSLTFYDKSTTNVTMAANTSGATIIPTTYSGYSALGVMGTSIAGASGVTIPEGAIAVDQAYIMTDERIKVIWTNRSSTDYTANVTARVFYKPTSLWD